MEKFTIVGVSRQDGIFKVRFGNDITRVKIMAKNGNTDIDMREMPHPMTKGEAVTYLMTTDLMDNGEIAEALENSNEKYNAEPKAKKPVAKKAAAAVVKAKKPVAKKSSKVDNPAEKLAGLKTRAKAKKAAVAA